MGKEEQAREKAKKDNTHAAIKEAFATENGKEGDDQIHLEPLIEAAHGWKVGEGPRRVLSPMFLSEIAVDELEKYLFLHTALENNLAEYQKLRARLKILAIAVKDINPHYMRDLARVTPSSTRQPKRASKLR